MFTATIYAVELADVNNAGSKSVNVLTVDDTEEGPWSRTLPVSATGTYRFTVRGLAGTAGPQPPLKARRRS